MCMFKRLATSYNMSDTKSFEEQKQEKEGKEGKEEKDYKQEKDYKNYTVERKLASGKYGTVYLVRFDNKRMVLKEVDIKHSNLIKSECDILRILKPKCSPYFICLEHCDESRGEIFLEYLDDYFDLFDVIYSNHPIPLSGEIIYTIAQNIIEAVKYLHALGVVHRDIKLENIMVNIKTGDIKLIDFGFSCDEKNCVIQWAGTENYTAPELKWPINQKTVDNFKLLKAMDIWSLGITLLVLLCADIEPLALKSLHYPITTHDINNALNVNYESIKFKNRYPELYYSIVNSIYQMLVSNPMDRVIVSLPSLLLGKRKVEEFDSEILPMYPSKIAK